MMRHEIRDILMFLQNFLPATPSPHRPPTTDSIYWYLSMLFKKLFDGYYRLMTRVRSAAGDDI